MAQAKKASLVLHDLLHVALLPFGAILVLGMVSAEVEAVLEKVHLWIDVIIVALSVHYLMDWREMRHQKHWAIHGAMHVVLVPLSAAIVLGHLDSRIEAFIERFDLAFHVVAVALTVHSLADWAKVKLHRQRWLELTPVDGDQWLAYAWDNGCMLAPAQLPQLIEAKSLDEAVAEAKRRLRKWARWRMLSSLEVRVMTVA